MQKTHSDFVEARRTRAIGLAGQAWLFKAAGSEVASWVETTQFHKRPKMVCSGTPIGKELPRNFHRLEVPLVLTPGV